MLFLLCIFVPVDGALDLQLIQPWMTPTGEFFLKHDWYLEALNHHYVKYILIAVYVFLLALWLGSYKSEKLKPHRKEYAYFFIMVILSTSLIGILKSQSDHACPWDMVIPSPNGYSWNFAKENGHCFPGGHASTGFALISGYFVYRLTKPNRAWFYLIAGLILGFGMGWAQMMRGAHFFSHNLWTLWDIWFFNVLIYGLSYKKLNPVV